MCNSGQASAAEIYLARGFLAADVREREVYRREESCAIDPWYSVTID